MPKQPAGAFLLLLLILAMAPARPSPPASLDDVLDQLGRVLALRNFQPRINRRR